jgi:hypothetical protein
MSEEEKVRKEATDILSMPDLTEDNKNWIWSRAIENVIERDGLEYLYYHDKVTKFYSNEEQEKIKTLNAINIDEGINDKAAETYTPCDKISFLEGFKDLKYKAPLISSDF